MPPAAAVPIDLFPRAPAPWAKNEWNQTADECKGSHENRSQTAHCAFQCGLGYRHAFMSAELGRHFHYEDGILSEQAYQHDQSNLGVYVVFYAEHLEEQV